MRIDETVLYEEFVRARQVAVELTDRYRETPADAADRAQLWERVVRQTETARQLLQSWLDEQEHLTRKTDRGPRELLIANH